MRCPNCKIELEIELKAKDSGLDFFEPEESDYKKHLRESAEVEGSE